jgi:MutS domain V
MKVGLLRREEDVDLNRPLVWNEAALTEDLALNTLFDAMARGDEYLCDVARKVVLSGRTLDLGTIRYRQEILRDSLNGSAVVRELYSVAGEAMESEKKLFFIGSLERHPDWLLRRSIELSETFLDTLRKLRRIADSHGERFGSEGWTAFFAMLRRELGDEYLLCVRHHLRQLKFRDGMLLEARLGQGNKGRDYTLLQSEAREEGWFARLMRLLERRPPLPGFSIHPRDDSGARALEELRNRGLCGAAKALAQATDHLRSFFDRLRTELAFYVGCLNLYEALTRTGVPVCFPSLARLDERRLAFRDLREPCLALRIDRPVFGNDADADDRELVIVTGANQGGKSTFLRSVGVAQLMMQCGMFVSAASFRSGVCDGLFTHCKREEDAAMKSGKLDEELGRMSGIVDHLTPRSMVLFNESFGATNEREGSEIARQVISALVDKGIRVVCVTHLYELAHGFRRRGVGKILFLRAERQQGGARTFRLTEGEPLETSFGEDLYDSVFGVGNGVG